jgi:hypothetical protein
MVRDKNMIQHPAFDKYNQDWRKVPEDALIQVLAENEHPDWVIKYPDTLDDILEDLFPDDQSHLSDGVRKGFESFFRKFTLDIEIYNQGLGQQVYKRRIEHIIHRGQTLERLKVDYILRERLNLEYEDIDTANKRLKEVAYAMKYVQKKPSDEQLLMPLKVGFYDFIKQDVGLNITNAYLTLFEIFKKFNFKDYATADAFKKAEVLKADMHRYTKKLDEAVRNPRVLI